MNDQNYLKFLSYLGIGLGVYIAYEMFTTKVVQDISYDPFMGYATDKYTGDWSIWKPKKPALFKTSDGSKVFEVGPNIYYQDV